MTKKKLLEKMGKLKERLQALEASKALEPEVVESGASGSFAEGEPVSYVINMHKGTFHRSDCHYLRFCYDHHQNPVNWTREECIEHDYKPCQICKA